MTDLERAISGKLRERAMQEVDTRGWDDADLAGVLNLFPDGARRLRAQTMWSVGTALTVLEKLGLDVEVKVV